MNVQSFLKKQIEAIKLEEDTLKKIEKTAEDSCICIKQMLKKKNIKADIFIGGSLAKKTLIKKNFYDIDLFVRFGEEYRNQDISRLLSSALGKRYKKVHGSRDYYQKIIHNIVVEIIPVLKIKRPQEAKNITDLSYFHVNYIRGKIKKNKKLRDDIILAKAFAYAQECYGAESYINGFSGYSLELLLSHYGSFLNFIKNLAKSGNNRRMVIDSANFYKTKKNIPEQLNKSKINSPIILIDPTFKERNALAGLSKETFLKFKQACLGFLKNPSKKFFEKKNMMEELKKRYKNKLEIISIRTNKQKGDIAGTKSKKFFKFFSYNLKKEFKIKKQEFEYDEKKNVSFAYFVLEKKPEEIVKGPAITKTENLTAFRKKHENAFIKDNFAYAKIKHNLKFKQFFNEFKKRYGKIIKQMHIKEIKIS